MTFAPLRNYGPALLDGRAATADLTSDAASGSPMRFDDQRIGRIERVVHALAVGTNRFHCQRLVNGGPGAEWCPCEVHGPLAEVGTWQKTS